MISISDILLKCHNWISHKQFGSSLQLPMTPLYGDTVVMEVVFLDMEVMEVLMVVMEELMVVMEQFIRIYRVGAGAGTGAE